MRRLGKILSKCDGPVYLSVNGHKDTTRTLSEYLRHQDIDADDLEVMLKTDTCINLCIVKERHSVGKDLYGHDIGRVMDGALAILEGE